MTETMTVPMDVRVMTWVANVLWALLGVTGLAALVWWGVRHPVWNLAGITVQGDVVHQNEVTLRAHLIPRLTGSFLTLDLKEVQRLFQGLPWVRQVVVQRDFPNRLTVTLQEHQAVAWWGEAGTGQMLNAQGEVFEANPDDPNADQWPELFGPVEQSGRVWTLFQAMQSTLARLDRAPQRLTLDGRGSWHLQLDQGTRIALGRGSDSEVLARLQTFVSTIAQLEQRYQGRDLESVDLRYPNGYAVRLRGVITLNEQPPPMVP
jgi:cell division protein FtsQ